MTPQITVVSVAQPPLTVVSAGIGLQGPAGPVSGSRLVAAGPLSGHAAITLDADGRAVYASCTNAAHACAVVGVTKAAAGAGQAVESVFSGRVESAGWGLTPDEPIFLGVNGALVQVLPPSALFQKIIGRAVSATSAVIEIQPAIFLA